MRFNLLSGGRGLATAAAALMSHDDKDAAQALGGLGAGRAEAAEEDDRHVVVEPAAGAGADAQPAAGGGDDKDKDKEKGGQGDENAQAADPVAARAEGFAAGTERCLAVMQSEHFAGREALATELLGSEMAADKIIGALAKATKGGGNAMLDALGQQPNPQLGAGAEPKGGQSAGQDSWARTMKRLGFVKE